MGQAKKAREKARKKERKAQQSAARPSDVRVRRQREQQAQLLADPGPVVRVRKLPKKAKPPKNRAGKRPKTTCCVSSSRCGRCPIRMLKEGTLPEGYGVRKRKLVQVETVAAARAAEPDAGSKRRQRAA